MKYSKIGSVYKDKVIEIISKIENTQDDSIEKASELFVEKIRNDELIYVYGVGGHSFVGSEEFFFRAGGLANISPMFELSLALAGGGQKSTMLERVDNIGDKIITANHLKEGDLVVITSAYGMNACTIDAALEAKRRKCKLIAISSVEFARNTPADFQARHHSKQNLYELADVTIDTCVPHGEVVLDVDNFEQRVGGTCNILQCFCINWLVSRTVERCVEEGIAPPVWRSANVVGGDEHNKKYFKKYTPRVKAL